MIRRLLVFALLVSGWTALADLQLDPSLIRRWNQSLETEYPGDRPVIAHYKHNKYELFYLAAAHSNDVNSPTLRLVGRLFTQHHFNALMVEPFPHSKGISPPVYLQLARNGYHGGFILGGEAALAILRANEKKIPFFGGEPDDHDIYIALKSRGYSDSDVLGFYMVRQIPQWVREKQNKIGLLERNVPKFINIYCKAFPLHPCPSLRDLRSWYKTRTDHELTVDISAEDVAPISDSGLFLQKISAAVGDVRDRFTLNVLQAALNKYKRVAVVYGSGHFVTLRKSLDKSFGRPSFETAP